MQRTIDPTQKRMVLVAEIVRQQGSWRWQKRLQLKRYYPTILRSGKLVWGNPEHIRDTSGGNLRGDYFPGEQSPYMRPLTAEECLAVYAYDIMTYEHRRH